MRNYCSAIRNESDMGLIKKIIVYDRKRTNHLEKYLALYKYDQYLLDFTIYEIFKVTLNLNLSDIMDCNEQQK